MSTWSWSYRLLKLRALGLLVLGRHRAAENVFDALLERWPTDAYGLSSRAHLRAEAGRMELAIADAERLVELYPDRSAAHWFNLAFMRDKADRLPAAEEAFRRALAMQPGLDRAWYGLALTLIRLGRLDEAVTALRRNTELQPMSPFGWYQLARVHAKRSEPEKARKIIEHLHSFEPKVAAQLERETGLVA